MAQCVRGNVLDSRLARVRLENQPEALAGQPAAPVIDEQSLFLVRGDPWPTVIQVTAQCIDGAGPQRDRSLATALARAPGDAPLEVDIRQIERDQLADPHSGRIERLEHGLIAEAFGTII